MSSVNEAQAAFEALLKSIDCPSCDAPYSINAVQWCDGWIEGRRDLLVEMNTTERDGPVKIRCEACGTKSWIDFFKRVATISDQ